MRKVLVGLVCVLGTGCFTIPSENKYDRTTEPRRPVTFENQEAATMFAAGRQLDHTPVDGTTNPFLAILCNRLYVIPSDAGFYNDAVQRCDTNQDGITTRDEAWYYHRLFKKSASD